MHGVLSQTKHWPTRVKILGPLTFIPANPKSSFTKAGADSESQHGTLLYMLCSWISSAIKKIKWQEAYLHNMEGWFSEKRTS